MLSNLHGGSDSSAGPCRSLRSMRSHTHPHLPRTGSSTGAWCETWLCPGGQSTAVNSAKGCPVYDLQSAARFGGTAPSCALLAAGAASDEPWEVRMIGIARGEIKQSSHGQ